MLRRLLVACLALCSGRLVYRRFLRVPVLNWGSRPGEPERALPGDELMPEADLVATRAVSIDAPPSAVWPWLVQMGPGRGGAYTYDWIENLFGLDMHSADTIHPEWQHIDVGDDLGVNGMRVAVLEPERALVSSSDAGDWVWAFALEPEGEGTRLLSRNRIKLAGSSAGQRLGMLVMEPGSLVMERKMLHGIKRRAELLAAGQRA